MMNSNSTACSRSKVSSTTTTIPAPSSSSSSDGHRSSLPEPKQQLSTDPKLFGELCLELVNNKSTILLLGDMVFVRHALAGGSACVVHTNVVANTFEDCEDKFGFPDPATRRPEGETSEQNIEVAGENNESMRKHVPNVPFYQCFPANSPLQTRSAEYLGQGFDGKRVLQAWLMEEFYPITQLKGADSLITVIRQVIEYYRRLYEEAHVMHGDITLNSIIFRKQNGQINGFFRDYDLSLFCNISEDRSNSLQRTGTTPYMVIDLPKENPISYFYRHDLESLFYVMVILTSRYHDGREIDNAPYADWFALGSKYMESQKIALISGPQEEVMLTPSFEKVISVILDLMTMFREGYQAKRKHQDVLRRGLVTDVESFDVETLAGHVDFDSFSKILFRSNHYRQVALLNLTTRS